MTRIETCTLSQPATRLVVLAVSAEADRVEVLPVVAVESRTVRSADGDRTEHHPVFLWDKLHTVDQQFAGHTLFTVAAPWPPDEDAARLADATAEARKIAPRVAELQREITAIREKHTPRLGAQLRTTQTGAGEFVCPGCDRRLERGDVRVTSDDLVVELFALGCSAHFELRLAVDGALTVKETRPCVEAPGPLFTTPES